MTTTVRIPWSREYDNIEKWNDVCAWAIERYGLPGDKFQTHANVDYMDFVFDNSKDALMMSLKYNARIIDDQQLALDFVGSLMS